jgi:PAS domain S-box-containing protein
VTEGERELDPLFEAIIQASSDFIGIVELDGRPRFLNDSGRRMVGFGDRDLCDTHVLDFFAEADRDRVRDVLLPQILAEGRWPPETHVRLRHWETGAALPVLWDAFRIDDPATGEPLAFATVTRDVSARTAVEQERDVRARQQALLVELGLRAIGKGDLQSLFDDAVVLLSRTLGVELAAIAEALPGGSELSLRALCGYPEEEIPRLLAVRLEDTSMAAHTLRAGVPIVSEDVMGDDRFQFAPEFAEFGAISAMGVVIPGPERPFGALLAGTKGERAFSEGDVSFVQAIANLLATAVRRTIAEQRVSRARDLERRRIARDLQDDALPELTAVLARVRRPTGDDAAIDPDAVRALARLGQRLRAAIYDLRMEDEEDRPFVELLARLVELQRSVSDTAIELVPGVGIPDGPLGARGTEILRVVGQAIGNARRHSGASRIRVSARGTRSGLVLEIADDGVGFDPEAERRAGAAGIAGMRERTARLGGELRIDSALGRGTAVTLSVPLVGEEDVAAAPIRVLLVDPHTAVRQAIAARFELEPGFIVSAQAGSLADARAALADVDVAVIDLRLPDANGAELIRMLSEVNPRAQALVLSAGLDRVQVARAIESGAADALDKTAELDEVVDHVRRLHAGETLVALDEVVQLLRLASITREQERSARAAIDSLTPREREVLQALADGLDSQGVADRLHISIQTQRNHVANILGKLGVHSQLQAVVFAVRYGVVEIR